MAQELEAGGTDAPGLLHLSASGIGRLTSCEERWYLHQTTPASERNFMKGVPLLLGTLMHSLLGAWYQGRSWQDEWALCLSQEIGWEEGFEAPEHFYRAEAIMQDWVTLHGDKSPWPMLAVELPFELPVPGVPGVDVRGFIDGMVAIPVDDNRMHDRLMLLEFKTMGRWGRERQVPWDPQLHLYLWAARQMFPVQGVIFEAVSTYKYKDPSPEKRFKRIELLYDQRLVDRAVDDLQRASRRGLEILSEPTKAVRSVGDACTWCDFRRRCHTPWELE